MAGYLKHGESDGRGPKKAKKRAAKPEQGHAVKVVVSGPDAPMSEPSMQHDINHVQGLDGIEASLDWIAKGIAHLGSEDFNFCLSHARNTYPVQITLVPDDQDDTMSRFVTALERIADSVAKLAGLTRPRLESWHEQDEYEPRYKSCAADGGAPGPKP